MDASLTKNSLQYKRNKLGILGELIKNKVLFLMLLPGTIVLILNNYLPMLGIFIAFKEIDYGKGLLKSDWAGLKNFKFFFKSSYSFIITRNTILYNIVFIILGAIVAIAFAIALNELTKARLKKFYQSVMFLPYFMSWIIISYLVFAFLGSDYGFINNSILKPLGLESVQWYMQKNVWPFILVAINIWKYAGYNSVVYLAAITGIESEYYEAAAIDGASKWQQITKITIPMLQPMIIILTLMALGRIFNADIGLFFMVPLDSGALYPVTNVLDTYVYRAMLSGIGDISMASAAGLYQSVVGFAFVVISNMIVKKVDQDKALF